MTGWEQIRLVEIPLAIPIIMAGIRTSTIYLIGWATLASFIGAAVSVITFYRLEPVSA